tara:strand:- start:25 stop:1119 length:1095 start_codon:yes stop_codon:yes gene_type:complete
VKKILLTISIFIIFPFFVSANEYLQIQSNGGDTQYKIMKWNSTTNTSTTLIEFTAIATIATNQTFVDEYNSKLYMAHSGETWTVYDIENNTISTEKVASNRQGANSGSYIYQYGWNGANTISSGSDSRDGSTTTILGSLDIKDSSGTTLIENKADGSTHIGENSLVTQEVNGVQQLYATNSAGNQIDINIKSGTNLLIDGTNVMTSINNNTSAINNLAVDISGSVALSSALAALPNSSPDAFYTCGLGTGIHDSSSALSAGCASDFSNYIFTDNLPNIFQTASFNIGSSFLMNGEPDISEVRDMSIKAGITFKFGSVKPKRVANKHNYMLENKIDAVMTENNLLKAQIAEINSQLKTLNMMAMN